MFPDSLRGGGAGGEVGVWVVGTDLHPLGPPHYHGAEGVWSGEAELAQYDDAHSTTRRRPILHVPYYSVQSPEQVPCKAIVERFVGGLLHDLPNGAGRHR